MDFEAGGRKNGEKRFIKTDMRGDFNCDPKSRGRSNFVYHPIFFAQIPGKKNMKPVKASLHAFVPTKALHLKPEVFFTSSPNSGSLACLSRHSSQSDGG